MTRRRASKTQSITTFLKESFEMKMSEEECSTSEHDHDEEPPEEESSKHEPASPRGIQEMWPIMPTELQQKILAPICIKSIFRLRCVDKFFNNVMFPNEAHNSFGAAAMSHTPAFYFKSTCFPLSVEWFTFDFQSNLWQKMKKFVTTMEVATKGLNEGIFLRHLYCFAKEGLINQFVFPAGGLLCILHESMREIGNDKSNPVKYAQTLFPFLVWNPLTNKSRELPPCKYNVRRNYSVSDSSFIHAFRDNATRSYKILCTLKDYTTTGEEKPLTTEIYDSRTGVWKECATYDGERMRSSFGSGQGVYCNGVVYFQLWRPRSWILFCFDVAREEWSEEDSEQRSLKLFEWNGMLMTTLPPLDSWNKYESAYVYRRDRLEQRWVDVGIAVPAEVRREFSRGEEIVASEDNLCLSGYDHHGTFKTAVYDKQENLWRLPSSAPSSKNLPPCELRFVFRYTPSFTAIAWSFRNPSVNLFEPMWILMLPLSSKSWLQLRNWGKKEEAVKNVAKLARASRQICMILGVEQFNQHKWCGITLKKHADIPVPRLNRMMCETMWILH